MLTKKNTLYELLSQKNFKPSSAALTISENLQDRIRADILNNSGFISFADFMQSALYAPGLGYYSAGSAKIGFAGDFVTAPEISPLFARCIAKQCEQILRCINAGCILEIGAGTGMLAVELLLELETNDCLPKNYLILETSADLRERQLQAFNKKAPHLLNLIEWLDWLPDASWSGIIIANEVLDAMPVHRFQIQHNNIRENIITFSEHRLSSDFADPVTPGLSEAISQTVLPVFHANGWNKQITYESEINLWLTDWLKSVTENMRSGLVLLIDYGFPRHEFYHPDRSMGTLMCHYRHHAHNDFLQLIGLQDITAHVDFTLLAESALNANLNVAGYTSQAAFLLNCGLLDLVNCSVYDGARQQLTVNQQVQKLTSPAEMGELFKVMALTRNVSIESLLGFVMHDRRRSL